MPMFKRMRERSYWNLKGEWLKDWLALEVTFSQWMVASLKVWIVWPQSFLSPIFCLDAPLVKHSQQLDGIGTNWQSLCESASRGVPLIKCIYVICCDLSTTCPQISKFYFSEFSLLWPKLCIFYNLFSKIFFILFLIKILTFS